MSDDAPEARSPELFANRYEITGVIGRGGMGEVNRAYDRELRRVVAIKRLIPGKGEAASRRARLLREARAVAQLNHANVTSVFDVGESEGVGFVVMEHVEGGSLQERMASGEPWSTTQALDWLEQLADALACAHDAGLVHRDIKPANLLVAANGQLKVADFGIAKEISGAVRLADLPPLSMQAPATLEGHVVGTPRYMAPEQLRGEPVDGRVDQFAWGIVAYALLTGEHPYDVSREPVTAQRVADGLFSAPPFPEGGPEVPAEVERVVLRALAADPAGRFPDMHVALRTLSEARGVERGSRPTVLRVHARKRAGVATAPMSSAPTKTIGGATATETTPHAEPTTKAERPGPPPGDATLEVPVGGVERDEVSDDLVASRRSPDAAKTGAEPPRRRVGRVAAVVAVVVASGTGAWLARPKRVVPAAPAAVAAAPSSAPVLSCGVDGAVTALAIADDRLYVAGSLDGVVCASGAGLRFDATSGARLPLATFYGTVRAAVADPERPGGYFVGGDFERVGDAPTKYLARISPDGSVDPGWRVTLDRRVEGLAVDGGVLYLAGAFGEVAGKPRDSVAAVTVSDGTLLELSAKPDLALDGLGVWGDTLYVWGFSEEISGAKRKHIASLDKRTGRVTAWHPDPDARVTAMLVDRGRVVVAGDFKHIAGAERAGLAVFDARTGALSPFRPDVPVTRPTSLAVTERTVLVGGRTPRPQIASLVKYERETGKRLPLASPLPNYPPDVMRVSGDRLYLGGLFDEVGEATRGHAAAIDLEKGALAPFDARAGDRVLAIATSGSSVFVGGDFSGAERKETKGLAVFDVRTGKPVPGPDLDGAVYAVVHTREAIYLGGAFDRVGDQPRPRFAVLDATTGALTPRTAAIERGTVDAIAVSGDTVLLAGSFESVAGAPHEGLVALGRDGPLPAFAPRVTPAKVVAVGIGGGRVFVGGDFEKIDDVGQKGLGALDLATGRRVEFPAVLGTVAALAVADDTLYVCGDFTSIGGEAHKHLAAVELGGAVRPLRLDALLDSSCDGVAVSGQALVVATGSVVLALDRASGRYLPFKGQVDRVSAVAAGPGAVFAAGRFQFLGGLPRQNLVALDPSTGEPR